MDDRGIREASEFYGHELPVTFLNVDLVAEETESARRGSKGRRVGEGGFLSGQMSPISVPVVVTVRSELVE